MNISVTLAFHAFGIFVNVSNHLNWEYMFFLPLFEQDKSIAFHECPHQLMLICAPYRRPLNEVLPESTLIQSITVFEIKGAPCTLCAHFGCRVHGFLNMCNLYVHDFPIF